MAQFEVSDAPDGSVVIGVIGEIDLAVTEELKGAVRPHIVGGSQVVLDLSDLEFIDSSGLGAFVQLLKEAAREGASLRLTHVRPSTYRLFEVTGLAAVFDIRSGTQDPDDVATT